MIHIKQLGSVVVLLVACAGACEKGSAPQSTTVTSSSAKQAPQPTSATTAAPRPAGGMGDTRGEMMMGDGGMGMMQGNACPMTVAGTNVQTAERPDGMDMTFTTAGDVAELRTRVRAMAEHMNAQSSRRGGRGHMHGGMHGGMMMGMPPVHANVEDVDGGARVHVESLDASRVADVRQRVQQGTQTMMQRHDCLAAPPP